MHWKKKTVEIKHAITTTKENNVQKLSDVKHSEKIRKTISESSDKEIVFMAVLYF